MRILGKIEKRQIDYNREVRKLIRKYEDKLTPEEIRKVVGYSECDLGMLKIDLEKAVKHKKV